MNYKRKYIKYKSKYVNLKHKGGWAEEPSDVIIKFVFEEGQNVMSKNQNCNTLITQNAGIESFQIKPGGLNGKFYLKLKSIGILDHINQELKSKENNQKNVIVNFDLNNNYADAMIYSVGPNLTEKTKNSPIDNIKDLEEDLIKIQNIYSDAISKIINHKLDDDRKIECFRLGLICVSIYEPNFTSTNLFDQYLNVLISYVSRGILNEIFENNNYLRTIIIQSIYKDKFEKILMYYGATKENNEWYISKRQYDLHVNQ